jgi:hypothetical protein
LAISTPAFPHVLIQVMTWLLAMKALLAGEISPEEFAPRNMP